MKAHPEKENSFFTMVKKKKVNELGTTLDHSPVSPRQTLNEDENDNENDVYEIEDDDEEDNDEFYENENQLVVYDHDNDVNDEIMPINYQRPRPFHSSSRILPSVGAFTVQCAVCFKWRLIPTKEKYEEIREYISENPFVCESARDWRPDISCDDEPDIQQDGSRLWAIDKPNIAQPPPGWERLLRIRAEGGSKFADVYYVAPSGKRLRSMVEIQRYLNDHPEYANEEWQPSQFSFMTPKPLQENYVRKRPARLTAHGEPILGSYQHEPSEVSPLAWAGPDDNTVLQLGGPGLSVPYCDEHVSPPPAKKQARRTPSNQPHDLHKVKVESPDRY